MIVLPQKPFRFQPKTTKATLIPAQICLCLIHDEVWIPPIYSPSILSCPFLMLLISSNPVLYLIHFSLSWFFSRWYWYYWYCRKSKTEDLLILSKCPQTYIYGLGKQEIRNPMYSTCMCQIYSTMITKNLVVVKCAMTPFKGQCFIISSAFRTHMLKSQWN